MTLEQKTSVDTIQATGAQMIDTIKKLVHEGNVRKVTIKQDGRTIAEFPLTFGVVGAVLAPAFAAIGAITALATDCTIEVERTEEREATQAATPA